MRRTLTSRPRRAVLAGVLVLGLGTLGLAVVPTAGAVDSVAQCSTADLSAQLKAGSPGAGQRYATVVLTNTSTHSCTLRGYGGVGPLGAPGQGVPTDLRRIASPSPTTLTVSPGGSVRSALHWTVIPAADEPGADCQPTAVTVVVSPPDQRKALLRTWEFGPVSQHGLIDQTAYVAGSAPF